MIALQIFLAVLAVTVLFYALGAVLQRRKARAFLAYANKLATEEKKGDLKVVR